MLCNLLVIGHHDRDFEAELGKSRRKRSAYVAKTTGFGKGHSFGCDVEDAHVSMLCGFARFVHEVDSGCVASYHAYK